MTAPSSSPVREPAWPVSRSAIGLWVTQGVLGTLLWAALLVPALLLLPTDDLPLSLLPWVGPVLLVLYAGVAIGLEPRIRYRVHRWEVTGEAVYAVSGWLTRTWTLVPISRIQTVDVTRGAVQQLYGLATIAVLTASSSGTVRVRHLPADVAERVAADLVHRAEQVRDEAT
ncbi:PH domain-containing protein [Blastococcus sp. URHD0036]|uniref:PH domain-containing protein n=1 Tax=Blastococcus sp. URHD0036 TaxID=1380356 RepID=UPI00068D911C|nr:PH domain-containing protein [Blastococcus sp. URHD0036]